MTPFQHHGHRKQHGITVCAEILLSMVNREEDYHYRVMELVEEAITEDVASQATLVNNLSSLRKKGLVLFKENQRDRRNRYIRVTRKGKDYLSKSKK